MPSAVNDTVLKSPRHFHATIFTYEMKDNNGNFMNNLHHEVVARSKAACIRKAKARKEPNQKEYHLQQLTECAQGEHCGGLDD